jgi:tetratricopeptide (TPR) repeat protein
MRRPHAQIIDLFWSGRLFEKDGEPDEALALSRRAIPLIPLVGPRQRRRHGWELAMALEWHAGHLRAGGFLEDAAIALQEAITIREEGLRADDRFELEWIGGVRWELAEDQLALGRIEAAIATAELALGDAKKIVDRRPDGVVDVGISLNYLARGLAAAGRWDEVLGAADEAIAIFRANDGGPDLAEALTHRSSALAATGHAAAARAAADEAGAIRTSAPSAG